VPKQGPAPTPVGFLGTAPCLNIVLAHEADDVDDFDGHVAAVITNVGDRRDPVPGGLDLRSVKVHLCRKEPQDVRDDVAE
jgi:hypothetical protein